MKIKLRKGRFLKIFRVLSFIFIFFSPIMILAGGGGGTESNAVPADSTNIGLTEIPNFLKCESFECLIQTIAGFIAGLVTVIGTIMIIIGGIQYITSAGNEDKARRAKNTILYAIIGIAIAVSVDFIIGFLREILSSSGD